MDQRCKGKRGYVRCPPLSHRTVACRDRGRIRLIVVNVDHVKITVKIRTTRLLRFPGFYQSGGVGDIVAFVSRGTSQRVGFFYKQCHRCFRVSSARCCSVDGSRERREFILPAHFGKGSTSFLSIRFRFVGNHTRAPTVRGLVGR